MQGAYCGECEWQHRVDGDDPNELSRAMIEHFVETGHSVERCDAEKRLENRADADGQPSEKQSEQPPASVSERDSNPRPE
ncbi:hypothetical protein HYG81_18750 [Natrinema zhouii]|uniref:hypothetical protein n=1 Tax=Natrinema zhouii TaxID=1710539 RepID=UPI001D000D58|nr:hypothetical protein [Natrinema zhouii]UHQ97975.1 hypothetical protein HYG81_18750 [Natrinema zhouii]